MAKNYHIHLRGGVGYWNFSREQVTYILDKHKDEEVHVLINSLGGYLDEALAISALFRIHGNVHCHLIGCNASAATIATMGAKRITIDADATYLVHKCLNEVFVWRDLNEDQLTGLIGKLEKLKGEQGTLNNVIANMYAKRCKKPKDSLMNLMKEDRWMTAKEAKEWGFVDEITDESDDKTQGLTKETVKAMAAAGLPMPPQMSSSLMPGWLRRLVEAFRGNDEPEPQDDTQDTTQPQITIDMHGTETKPATAVTEQTAVAAEETATQATPEAPAEESAPTEEAATTASAEASIAELNAKIAELEAKVSALSQEPAATTSTVTNTAEPEPDADKMAEALLNMYK